MCRGIPSELWEQERSDLDCSAGNGIDAQLETMEQTHPAEHFVADGRREHRTPVAVPKDFGRMQIETTGRAIRERKPTI